jgi:hypothetical protein
MLLHRVKAVEEKYVVGLAIRTRLAVFVEYPCSVGSVSDL